MKHRAAEHPTKKACRYFKVGTCSFQAEDCWYSHEEKLPENENPNEITEEAQDFRMETKNLPPDMKMLINQIIKIASKTKN